MIRQPFFSSDLHVGHRNVIKHCNRPFSTVEEMDEYIIVNWNKKIAPEDTVYILGDLSMHKHEHARKIISQLNGQLHLIRGNHDKGVENRIRDLFVSVSDYKEVKVPDKDGHGGKQKIILSHYAFRVWNSQFRGSWHLYGHSHGSLPQRYNYSMDVGIDTHPQYVPYSYQEIKDLFATHKIDPEDGHVR